MAGISEKLTIDVLSSIARIENNSSSLSTVRRDLYPAMMDLYTTLVKDCDRLAAENPDSVMFDGINERRRTVQKKMRLVTEKRLKKIADLALRNAMGANNPTEMLTPEEKEYYDTLMAATTKHWNLLEKKKAIIPDITRMSSVPEPEPVPTVREIRRTETRVSTATIEIPTEESSDDVPAPIKETISEPVIKEETVIEEDPADETAAEGPVLETAADDPVAEEQIENESISSDDEELRELIEVDPVPEPAPTELDFNEEFVIIRITSEGIPPFSGPDRNYNLVKEDVVRMPTMMAAALVNRGLAVIIPTP